MYHIYHRTEEECKANKPLHHIAFEDAADAAHWLEVHTSAYNFYVYREVMEEITSARLYKYAQLEGDE